MQLHAVSNRCRCSRSALNHARHVLSWLHSSSQQEEVWASICWGSGSAGPQHLQLSHRRDQPMSTRQVWSLRASPASRMQVRISSARIHRSRLAVDAHRPKSVVDVVCDGAGQSSKPQDRSMEDAKSLSEASSFFITTVI